MGLCCTKQKPQQLPNAADVGVEEALRIYYKERVLPLEKRHDYAHFYGPILDDAEFSCKPSVMLMGEYSVGKTCMIKYLLGGEYPGSRVGPEPTTDRIIFISHNINSRQVPGSTLIADPEFPWKSMKAFGQGFLQTLMGAQFDSAILEYINFVDTPGILSGDKQETNRNYSYSEVMKYLCDKVDRIYLLFDANKLDISPEFKSVLVTLQGRDNKIRMLLNKADGPEPADLDRIRQAIMWNLGKVLKCAEVPKVYIGSFWEHPLKRDDPGLKELFLTDYQELLKDLSELPRTVKIRKINDMLTRAKIVKVHAIIMTEMIQRMPCKILNCRGEKTNIAMASHQDKIDAIWDKMEHKLRIPLSDLPDKKEYMDRCKKSDWKRWNTVHIKALADINEFIDVEMPLILEALPSDAETATAGITAMQESITRLAIPANIQMSATDLADKLSDASQDSNSRSERSKSKSGDSQSQGSKSRDSRSGDSKSGDSKSGDSQSGDAKSGGSKSGGSRPQN